MIKTIKTRLNKSSYWTDILWQASGNSFAQAIGILIMPILTRLYTPEDFAILGLFTQVVAFLTIMLTWRYEHLLKLPKEDFDSNVLLKIVFILGFIGFIIFTIIMNSYGNEIANLLGAESLGKWLIFAPLTAMLISISVAIQQKAQRQEQYKNSGFSEICNKLGYAVSSISGAILSAGIAGLILASTIGALSKIVWLKHFKNNDIQRHNIKSGSHNKVNVILFLYAKLSMSISFSHIMLAFTGGIPIFLINKMYGTETLGHFTLVVSTLYLPSSLIGNAIGQVYYQRAAKRNASGLPFNDLWKSTAIRLLLVGVPLYTLVALVSPWAYPFVFGEVWASAGEYAVLLSISAFFSFATAPLDKACLVVNAWWYIPIWHTTRALTTGLVAWLAWTYAWPFDVFLTYLVIQMVSIYLIDYLVEWYFSSLKFREKNYIA